MKKALHEHDRYNSYNQRSCICPASQEDRKAKDSVWDIERRYDKSNVLVVLVFLSFLGQSYCFPLLESCTAKQEFNRADVHNMCKLGKLAEDYVAVEKEGLFVCRACVIFLTTWGMWFFANRLVAWQCSLTWNLDLILNLNLALCLFL